MGVIVIRHTSPKVNGCRSERKIDTINIFLIIESNFMKKLFTSK